MAQNTADDPRSTDLKLDMAYIFAEVEEEYREQNEVVSEDSERVVLADHQGYEINELASELGMDRDELSSIMHELARGTTEYDWSAADPLVFDKIEN